MDLYLITRNSTHPFILLYRSRKSKTNRLEKENRTLKSSYSIGLKLFLCSSGRSFVLYLSQRKYNQRVTTIRTTTKPQKNSTTLNGNYAKLCVLLLFHIRREKYDPRDNVLDKSNDQTAKKFCCTDLQLSGCVMHINSRNLDGVEGGSWPEAGRPATIYLGTRSSYVFADYEKPWKRTSYAPPSDTRNNTL